MKSTLQQLGLTAGLTILNTCANAEFYLGSGMGTSTVSGDFSRTIKSPFYELGMDYETDSWLFHFSGESATDNRFKALRVFGGYGNEYIKVGTGLIGVQSSIPTTPGIIGGFYQKETSHDTAISSTSIPLIVRVTPFKSKKSKFMIEGFYGLYQRGSITVPIKVGSPNNPAFITSESKSSGNTFGLKTTFDYKFTKHLKLRLNFESEYGQLNKGQSPIVSDTLGVLPPINIPAVKFNNRSVSLSLIYPAE